MNAVRPEAAAAAEWWAGRLGHARQDIGTRDPDQAAFVAFASAAGRTFTDEQREAFRRELEGTVEEHLRKWGCWEPEQPRLGSALRCFGVDYGADPVLTDAAERAGIHLRTLDLPLKTVMWVNPGEVSVSEGYGAEPVTIWRPVNPISWPKPGDPGRFVVGCSCGEWEFTGNVAEVNAAAREHDDSPRRRHVVSVRGRLPDGEGR